MIDNLNIYCRLSELSNIQPLEVAVSFNDETIDYAELKNMVSSVAEGIYRSDVNTGDRVAIIMDNSINMVVTILAILSNRCVVLPIDCETPVERIQIIINDAKPKLLLCDSNFIQDKLKHAGCYCAVIETIPRYYAASTNFLEACGRCCNDDGAFCMYTSGTTGKPKGVILSYRGIMNHIESKINLLNLNHESKVCLSFNTSFVASIWQLLTPILLGAQLVLYPKDLVKKPYSFLKRLQKDEVNFVCMTPHTLKSYLEYLRYGKMKLSLDNIKYIVLTGEKIDVPLVTEFYNQYENIEIINAYGQTECSDDTFHFVIPRLLDSTQVPIGRPIPNMYYYILDDDFHPVEIGTEGELFIGGFGVAKGYFAYI